MALKRLYSGRVRGTNAALAAPNSEHITIYTVPASKVAVIKNITYWPRGNSASVTVTIYVLKTGLTDSVTTNYLGSTLANHDVITLAASFASNAAMGTLNTTVILEAGDKLNVEIAVTTGTVDVTGIGVNIHVSGDES